MPKGGAQHSDPTNPSEPTLDEIAALPLTKQRALGKEAYSRGRYAAAVRYLTAAESASTAVPYTMMLATALFHTKDHFQCIKWAEVVIKTVVKAKERHPETVREAFLLISKARLAQGRVVDARKYTEPLLGVELGEKEQKEVAGVVNRIDGMEGRLLQGVSPSLVHLWRSRAAVWANRGAVPPPARPPPLLRRSMGGLLKGKGSCLHVLLMGLEESHYIERSVTTWDYGAHQQSTLDLHVVSPEAACMAKEVLLLALSLLQYGMFSPTSPLASMRLRMLQLLLAHSLGLPAGYSNLLRRILGVLSGLGGTITRLNNLLHCFAQGKIPDTPSDDEDPSATYFADPLGALPSLRKVWRQWEAEQDLFTHLLASAVTSGCDSLSALAGAAWVDTTDTIGRVRRMMTKSRQHLPTDVLLTTLLKARTELTTEELLNGVPDMPKNLRSDTAHWLRCFTIPVPEDVTLPSDLPSDVSDALATPAARPPPLHEWVANPTALLPATPLGGGAVPGLMALVPSPFFEILRTIADRVKDSPSTASCCLARQRVKITFYVTSPCTLLTNHLTPSHPFRPSSSVPCIPPPAPPAQPIKVGFDIIDTGMEMEKSSVTSLLVPAVPLLRPGGCLVTRHVGATLSNESELVKYIAARSLAGSTALLEEVHNVKIEPHSSDPVTGDCAWVAWRRGEHQRSAPEPLDKDPNLRLYIWRHLEALSPRESTPGDKMHEALARDFPLVETAGQLVALLNHLYSRGYLVGRGFLESLQGAASNTGQGLSADIVTLLPEVHAVCRAALPFLHECVVAEPAVTLPLAPLVSCSLALPVVNPQPAHLPRVALGLLLVHPALQVDGWEHNLQAVYEANREYLKEGKSGYPLQSYSSFIITEEVVDVGTELHVTVDIIDDFPEGTQAVLVDWETLEPVTRTVAVADAMVEKRRRKKRRGKKKKTASSPAAGSDEDDEEEEGG